MGIEFWRNLSSVCVVSVFLLVPCNGSANGTHSSLYLEVGGIHWAGIPISFNYEHEWRIVSLGAGICFSPWGEMRTYGVSIRALATIWEQDTCRLFGVLGFAYHKYGDTRDLLPGGESYQALFPALGYEVGGEQGMVLRLFVGPVVPLGFRGLPYPDKWYQPWGGVDLGWRL